MSKAVSRAALVPFLNVDYAVVFWTFGFSALLWVLVHPGIGLVVFVSFLLICKGAVKQDENAFSIVRIWFLTRVVHTNWQGLTSRVSRYVPNKSRF